ncbi:MAG: glycerol-3-phosphate acyltransferase [Lachnospiraceae bacterium]|nr:glycerol-3-phosphate acyltransferase [Lachnospiraceae bacterium]
MKTAICILIGYLSGSVLNAYILPKCLCRIDVTEKSEDGNPGAANAFLQAGIPVGILVIILEIMKGYWPLRLGVRWIGFENMWFVLLMAAPVLGHAYPFWRRWKGGKAIAVSFGVLLGIWPHYQPLLLLASFYLIFSLILRIPSHAYRSIATYACFLLSCLGMVKEPVICGGCILIAAIVMERHIKSLQALKYVEKEEQRNL